MAEAGGVVSRNRGMKFKVVHKPAGERLRGHVRALRARDGLFLLLDRSYVRWLKKTKLMFLVRQK